MATLVNRPTGPCSPPRRCSTRGSRSPTPATRSELLSIEWNLDLPPSGFFPISTGARRATSLRARWTLDWRYPCLLSVPLITKHHQSPKTIRSNQFAVKVTRYSAAYHLTFSKHINKRLRNYLLAVENLALGKPATQSDVLWSYKPGLAVDGDPNTCSFTSREETPRWWQVSTKLMLLVTMTLPELSEYFICLGNFAGVYYPQLCVLFNRLIGCRLAVGVCFQASLAVIPFTFVIAHLLRPIISYFLPQYQHFESKPY